MASYSELNDPMEGAFVITGNRRKLDKYWLEILRSEKNDLIICYSFRKERDKSIGE